MARCINPKPAWRPPHGGRYILNMKDDYETKYGFDIERPHAFLPCRQCPVCAQSIKKDWTIRIIHEAQYHEVNCALTLTFSPEVLEQRKPMKWSVYKSDVTKFIKKLRTYINRYENSDVKIKYYAAGEYGSKTNRPHYHIIIFGWVPSDIDVHGKSTVVVNNASEQHHSQFIDRVWNQGRSTVGLFTGSSAGYIAGYVNKKLDNKENNVVYSEYVDGERLYRHPEFNTMSEGIGRRWIYDNYRATFFNGFITHSDNERVYKYSIPPYYLRCLESIDPVLYEKVRSERLEYLENSDDYQLMLSDPTAFAEKQDRMYDYHYTLHNRKENQRNLE